MTTTPATTFEDVQTVVADVEGWMTPGQAERLWSCARAVPASGLVVEIGSFRGRSMIVLASAAPEGTDLVAIDPHAGNDRGPQELEGFQDEAATDHEVFKANLRAAGVQDRVRHVRKFSGDALGDVAGDIDLLYIDGAHRFGPAVDDIRRWSAKVRPGGELLIHDSFSSVGVTAALAVTLVFGSRFRYLGRSQSMTHYRCEPVRGVARVANAARQLASLPWFLRNLVIKALILAKLGPATRVLGHDPATWPY
jgi:predicted O-methyltransferase YrrM